MTSSGGIGSATGAPAPGAGTTGSWLTLDLKRAAEGRRRKVRVTKTAAFDAGAQSALTKLAYGRNSSVGPTGPRDGPQTPGEAGAESGASGVGATDFIQARGQVTRRGARGGRGVPEWVRAVKFLHAPATWTGGDRAGAKVDDRQFETPYAGATGVRP